MTGQAKSKNAVLACDSLLRIWSVCEIIGHLGGEW